MSENTNEANPQQALPTWIWGATAFVAGYMVFHLQAFAA